ncbi:MAG: hypothetical protein A2X46_05235 [Lentisphaerae bacterium GWF2_57_35]|nr:MAG: hypothetical protein A2X46_05235 [Lentisphaerae bacterium GWF2_57_35]
MSTNEDSNAPLVSVITSTYNRAELLRRAVQSVLLQSFSNWEHIIVGDCTPDHSADVVESFKDARLRFVNLSDKSPPRSHGAIVKNYGIRQMARSEYIAYLDDDDCYHPDFLQVMMDHMTRRPDLEVAYCRSAYKDKTTGRRLWGNPFQRWLHGYSKEKLKRYNFLNTNCVVHKKSLLEVVGYWNPAYFFDDYELWLRMSERCDFSYVNSVLADTYVDEPAFIVRAFSKGWAILTKGRRTPVE